MIGVRGDHGITIIVGKIISGINGRIYTIQVIIIIKIANITPDADIPPKIELPNPPSGKLQSRFAQITNGIAKHVDMNAISHNGMMIMAAS